VPRIELFPFQCRDSRIERWGVRRYNASIDDVALRHAEWEVIGPPDVRMPVRGWFSPYRNLIAHAELRPNHFALMTERSPSLRQAIRLRSSSRKRTRRSTGRTSTPYSIFMPMTRFS
jgi:hypothetical protein